MGLTGRVRKNRPRSDCFETYLGQECSFGSSHERIDFVRASVFVVDVTTPKSLPARCWTFCLFLLKTHYIVEGFSNSVTSANPVAIQPTAEPQNLSWREAIVEVLKGANGAMHYSDIADEIVARRLRSEIGPTPVKTVAATLSISISKQGDHSEFIRAGRGEYMLRSLYEPGHQQPNLPEPTAEELENEVDTASEETTGIIQALGMYWSRSLIVWTNNPTLQGQQQTGAKPVDFLTKEASTYFTTTETSFTSEGRLIKASASACINTLSIVWRAAGIVSLGLVFAVSRRMELWLRNNRRSCRRK